MPHTHITLPYTFIRFTCILKRTLCITDNCKPRILRYMSYEIHAQMYRLRSSLNIGLCERSFDYVGYLTFWKFVHKWSKFVDFDPCRGGVTAHVQSITTRTARSNTPRIWDISSIMTYGTYVFMIDVLSIVCAVFNVLVRDWWCVPYAVWFSSQCCVLDAMRHAFIVNVS